MKFILTFFYITVAIISSANEAITYSFSGGRFGDQLLSYLHAKWLSYEYDIPILYQPFPYSSELTLDNVENRFEKEIFKEHIYIKTVESILPKNKSRSILYTCPYFAEAEYERNRYCCKVMVNWKDPDFRLLVKSLIMPKKKLQLIEPSSESVNIAVHARLGGGYDSRSMNHSFPLKLPSFNFYIDGLKKIASYFEGRSLYCFVFTDDPDPETVAKLLKEGVNDERIVFDYRKENHHTKNVLEDFFSFFNFDALVRPDSNFSIIPSVINDYAIVISPKTYHRANNDEVEVDKFEIAINQKLYQDLLNNADLLLK